jgi:hypothetical protein
MVRNNILEELPTLQKRNHASPEEESCIFISFIMHGRWEGVQ